MKIVYTLEEVKNIIADFTVKQSSGNKPIEVVFIHKYCDNSGESNIEDVTKVDRIEVRY